MRLPPPIIALLFAILIILSSRVVPMPWAIAPHITQILAVALFVIGVCLDLESVLRFFKAKTTINPIKPANSKVLVTNGFYNITRNPMYLGMVFFLSAITVWMSALLGPVLIALFMILMTRGQIKHEEKALTEIFGEDYIEYCQHVRRWL